MGGAAQCCASSTSDSHSRAVARKRARESPRPAHPSDARQRVPAQIRILAGGGSALDARQLRAGLRGLPGFPRRACMPQRKRPRHRRTRTSESGVTPRREPARRRLPSLQRHSGWCSPVPRVAGCHTYAWQRPRGPRIPATSVRGVAWRVDHIQLAAEREPPPAALRETPSTPLGHRPPPAAGIPLHRHLAFRRMSSD